MMKKLDDKQIQKITKLYEQGATDEMVATALGIHRATLHRWKVANPELLHAIKVAKDVVDDLVELSLFNRAIGYSYDSEKIFYNMKTNQVVRVPVVVHVPPDPTSIIFHLKNRRPDRWRDVNRTEVHNINPKPTNKATFEEFCVIAGYPKPYPQQVDMMNFAIKRTETRLLLGARGYGKTDYCSVLGVAYEIYEEHIAYCNGEATQVESTNLIISKSQTRNASMMQAIANILEANGVELEKKNTSVIRVKGLVGKDHSVESITIKSSLRGRHPKRIICDDIVTEEDTSDAMRTLVSKKYSEAYKLTSNICIIGQPAHTFDLYADLRPILCKLEVPHGSIPELDADLEAMKLAGVDERSIQMSYHLQVPADSDNALSKVQFVDSYQLSAGNQSVAFIDPSFEGGDYTAMTVLTRYFDGVMVEGYVWKKAWNHVIDEMAAKMKALRVAKVCIETNALGDQPVSLLRAAVPHGVGVVGKKSLGNKHARIMAAGVFAKQIHLSKRSDKIYIDQVVKYEYKAQHDDAPDSLASCLEWVGLIQGQRKS